MSGEEGTPKAGETGGAGEGGNKPPEGTGFKPITYNTQAEMDAAFADRATRAGDAARQEALKDLPQGADLKSVLEGYTAWKTAEDAKKDPAVREREAHEATQRELAVYKAKEAQGVLAREVAKDLKIGEHPIPAELLAGTTKEEVVEHGKSIIAFIEMLAGGRNGVKPPAYNPNQGHSQQDQVKSGDPIRNLFMTGQF
jgi:hypothetical protein